MSKSKQISAIIKDIANNRPLLSVDDVMLMYLILKKYDIEILKELDWKVKELDEKIPKKYLKNRRAVDKAVSKTLDTDVKQAIEEQELLSKL